MSVVNNDVLGQMRPAKNKKSIGLISFTIGSFLGILFSLALKTLVVYVLWNLFLPQCGFQKITLDSSYAMTAILSLLMIKYSSSSSGLEMSIDLILKSITFLLIAFCLTYF